MSSVLNSLRISLTHAVSTGALAITLGPQLIALITGSADPPSNGARGSGAVHCPAAGRAGSIVGMLAMPGMRAPELRALVDVPLLLKLLEGVLGAVGQGVQAGAVEVPRGRVVGQHVARGEGVVGREAVQRVGEHLVAGARADVPPARGGPRDGGEGDASRVKCRRPLYHRSGEQVSGTRRCGDVRGNAERKAMAGCAWRCWCQDSCSI
jgi:hypothetical protein